MKNSVNIISAFRPTPSHAHLGWERRGEFQNAKEPEKTSQCVWNRNLEPRRYRTNCVTAAIHCGTGTWNLRHSSRGTRTWNP